MNKPAIITILLVLVTINGQAQTAQEANPYFSFIEGHTTSVSMASDIVLC